MVILKDLFTMLASGEFSNISLSRDATGGINESEYEKIIGHINLGLVEIYKRFKLMENELLLHVTPNVMNYYLRDERVVALHQISESRYIQRPDDFEGCLNIVEVTGVYDSLEKNLVMNNRFASPAILQMAPDTLKITKLTAPQIFTVTYQAYPTKIVLDDDLDPATFALPIPETILEALLYYVAFRVYKPAGANNSTANADKSASYQQQYELSCQKLAVLGLDIQNDDQENTFEAKGWA